MQDRYVGDIGDFGKYALLRTLAGNDLRLGVVWHLNPDEEGNRDGGKIDYLKKKELRPCDPCVFDILERIVREEKRSVSAIQKSGLLGRATFFEDKLRYGNLGNAGVPGKLARKRCRDEWCSRALKKTLKANLVFLDPDNGLSVESAEKDSMKTPKIYRKRGNKYVSLEEVRQYFMRGQSVVVYQHQTRTGMLGQQVETKLQLLKDSLKVHEAWALTWHRVQVRIYFVLSHVKHTKLLRERSRELVEGPFKGHFKPANAR